MSSPSLTNRAISGLVAPMLAIWLGGWACMICCIGMAETARQNSNALLDLSSVPKISTNNNSSNSSNSSDDHSCCRLSKGKQTTAVTGKTKSAKSKQATISPQSASGPCCFTLSKIVDLTRSPRMTDLLAADIVAAKTLPALQVKATTKLPTPPVIRPPIRGEIYLRCCTFLI